MTESEKFLTTINRINQQCSQAVSAMPGSQCSGALWESQHHHDRRRARRTCKYLSINFERRGDTMRQTYTLP